MDKTLERILSLIPKNDKGRFVHGAKADFARSLGFDGGDVVSMWIKGTSKSYRNYLPDIAARHGVSVDWLLGNTDDPAPHAQQEEPEIAKKYRALDEHGKKLVDAVLDLEYRRCTGAVEKQAEIIPLRTIRHYLVPAAAGYASPIEGEEFETIPLPPDAPPGADFCITVRGDSMEPYIHDGQVVFVQRGAQLQEFDVGVFYVDGDVFCKQWCVDYGGTLHLLSANPKRQDANISIPREAGITCVCFGKVLLPHKLPEPFYE